MDKQELRKKLIEFLENISTKQLESCLWPPNIPSVVDEYVNKIKDTPTIQVDAKEYERLKQLDYREIINQFNNRHCNYSYGMVIHKIEETKEDKDQSTFILLVSIVILLGYIIYKIETYFN